MRRTGRKGRIVLLTLGVSALWAGMMGALVVREARTRFQPADYRVFLNKDTLLSDQWLGIYAAGTPVGFMHTAFEPHVFRPGVAGYRITNRTFLNISLLREQTKVWFDSEAIVDERFQMQRFSADFSSGTHRLRVQGTRQAEDRIAVEIDSQGVTSRREIVIPRSSGVVLASMLTPFQSFGRLETGTRFDVQVFNPFTLEIERLAIHVGPRETLALAGGPQKVFVVDTEYRGVAQRAWVNDQGEIVKQQTVMGWEIIKEDADVVQRVYEHAGKTNANIIDAVSLPLALAQEPRALQRLILRFSGIGPEFALNSHRQRVKEYDPNARQGVLEIIRQQEPTAPAAFPQTAYPELRQATPLLQSDAPLIRETAQAIVAGTQDSWEAARRINRWVFQQIRKRPVVSIPSAVDVLTSREGDCNEHTALCVALCRAVGIPAQMNIGLAYADKRLWYHAWPSVFVGEWVDMDPTFGHDLADPAHIRLIEGDLSKQLDIIMLLGRISLQVVSAE